MSSKTTVTAAAATSAAGTAAAAETAASDKVEVSFATDDEEETSSSSDESEEETSSSSSGEEEKSDGDADADDESDVPTFTLSLQTSTATTNDADDALPDLSRSAATSSKQETQQETVTTKVSSVVEIETKIEAATSQLTVSSTEVDGVVTEVARETSSVPEKEETEKKSPEESQQETEDKEEEEKHEEQHPSSSSTATESSSTVVSTNTDTKEDVTITSSKLSLTDSKTSVQEVSEEQSAIIVVEAKTTLSAEVAAKTNASDVTEVEDKHSSATKVERKSPVKETVVTEQTANVKNETTEQASDLSRTAAAKTVQSEIINNVEVAPTSSYSNPDQQPSKYSENDQAPKEPKLETEKADVVYSTLASANVVEVNDLKRKDKSKETPSSPTKATDKKAVAETTVTKIPKICKTEETNKAKAQDQSETVDNPESNKSRKKKVNAKEIKQDITATAEEEHTASVVVEIKQNSDNKMPEKFETNIETVNDTVPPQEVNSEKTKEADKVNKGKNVAAASEKTTDKSEIVKSSGQKQTDATADVAINGSDVAQKQKNAAGTETSEGKLPSKKVSKHLTVDSKESEVKSTVKSESPVAADDMKRDDKKRQDISESNAVVKTVDTSTTEAASKTDVSKSSVIVAQSQMENAENVTEIRQNKAKSLPAASVSHEAKFDDKKVNSAEEEGKLLAGDDAEFRPRRNSIDEFIKRILAEAREEQKKILDSCAVSSGGETTSETGVTNAANGVSTSTKTELEPPQQQPMVNGVDVGMTTRTARRNREDIDIDDELADISRYYAKRTLVDRVPANDEEPSESIQTDDSAKSKTAVNDNDGLPPTSSEEMLHFVPQRSESTATVVRESSRPVRVLLDQQTSVIRQLTEASRSVDELDNEVRHLRQSIGGRETLYSSIGAAIRDELRLYEMELIAASERIGHQRLPGGGRFVREQFVAQCASELLLRSATVNGPRLDRATSVDEWTRGGRRRSGSFSAGATADEDLGGGSRYVTSRQWIPPAVDRDTTDPMIQYRYSRSGSVVSDRGGSSVDTAVDESRNTTTSSLLSRLAMFNVTNTATELDSVRNPPRASSEAPRHSFQRSQTVSDDWLSTESPVYSVGRQYTAYSHPSTDTNSELDVGYRVSAARSTGHQSSYRSYQPPTVEATTSPHSRLYVRRGSLQSYASYDAGTSAGSGDAGRSFNSRFLSRVREKKALGETTSRQASADGDRPFRSRFLKSSSVTGSGTSSSYSRSAVQYESDDN